jgi:hypothetical protein
MSTAVGGRHHLFVRTTVWALGPDDVDVRLDSNLGHGSARARGMVRPTGCTEGQAQGPTGTSLAVSVVHQRRGPSLAYKTNCKYIFFHLSTPCRSCYMQTTSLPSHKVSSHAHHYYVVPWRKPNSHTSQHFPRTPQLQTQIQLVDRVLRIPPSDRLDLDQRRTLLGLVVLL